ncbi:MAG: hypothetical protein HOK72_04300, partial [Flavobacteriales bacterium]|nr:hypothetical protein [Flavobacteriales bacterium]
YNIIESSDFVYAVLDEYTSLDTLNSYFSGTGITTPLDSIHYYPGLDGFGTPFNDTLSGIFDPATAGLGAHNISFLYSDTNNCSFVASDSIVVQEASGTFTAIDSNYCEGTPWQGISVSVNNSNGADGNFYGRGVNDPASTPLWGQFSPTIAGVGADTIYFTYFGTDGVTEFTIDTIINVSPLPAINFSVDTLLNITQGAYLLPPTATPYSSNQDTSYFTFNIGGVSTESNTFFPTNAGIGNTTITYTYTDALGCTNTAMDAIEIDTARGSFYNLPLNNFYCNNDPLDTIWAIPINGDGSIGIYSEPSGNLTNIASSDSAQFNPALFTPGQYTISYTYMGWDGNTPFTIDTIINFTANPAISFDLDTLFNITEGPYYLPAVSTIVDLGSIASQVYSSSGNGLTGNFFYPDSAGLGNFDVSYIVTDTIGCVSTIIDSTVVQEASGIFGGLPSNNNYCIDAPIDSIWVSGVLNGNPQPCNQIDIEITTGPNYAEEIYWTITDNLAVVVDSALINTYPINNTVYSATYNIGSGTGFNFNAYDSYGDGWNGGTYIITSTCFGTVLATNGGATPNNGTPGANTIESTEIFNNDAVYTGSFSGNGVSNTTVPDTAIVNPSANSPGLLTISYQYFGFDSTTLFTIDTTVNIAPLPVLTFDMDTLFNIVEPPYSLANSWTSANIGVLDTSYFSGIGITDSSFYPDSAGVGDFIISFTYIDDTGCAATITDHTIVQAATANWFGIPNNNFYCSDGTVDIIWATSAEIDPNSVGWYTSSISSNPALFDIDGQFITDSANYSPADLSFISADSIIVDTVTYHYNGFDGTTEFTVDTAIFTINLGLANITGFAPTYCIDAENDTLFGAPSFNAGGGIFSSISIGLNNLGDTAIFNPNAAGAGLHDIQYQYTDTSSSCYVDGNIQVEVFALPNLAINLPAIGNDLPSGEYCMSVDTVNITGQVNGLLASIGDYWGNGVSNFITNDGEAYFHPDSVGIQDTLVVTDTIWYSYTDPITNCFSTTFKEVFVRSLPNPYIDGLNGQDPNAIVSGYYCQNFGDIFMNYGNNVLGGGFQSVDWLVNGLASSNQINTNNLPDTVIPIQLTYTDNYGCINLTNDTIVINPHPIGSFSVEDQCITTPINFTDLSSIDTSLGDSISSWQWNFGVLGANDSIQNPSYLYEATNPVQINLSVTSNNGCGASFDSVLINLGTKPPSDFSWINECYEDTVLFSVADITSSFPGIIIYKWDFGDGVLTDTTLADTMSHEYNNVQPYNVQLIVNTSSGCTDTTVKTLNVRPFYTPTLSNPYTADFESGKDGWLAESIGLSSWEFGTPNNSLLNSAYSGDSAWVTGIDTNYYDAENSWIASPCYDLSLLERPMVKVWINSAMQENDGAVLQSTINSGVSWQNVGAVNTGINWFNLNGLEGSPGEQSITQGNVGWSDTTSSWTEGRHSLDNLLAETKVRFRIAFGSNT